MKKLLVILLALFLFSIFINRAQAAATDVTPSASPSASQAINEKLNQQINDLKEKIASHVAQLNLVEKRGILGVVSAVSNNQVTLTDISGNIRFVDVDEITKFSSPSDSSFGHSDLKKGTKVSVLGLFNKQSERILARFIDVSVDPTFLSGEIADLDKTNIMLTLKTEETKQIKIDIQTTTKMSVYASSDGSLTHYGFSKLNIGDRLAVVGFPEKQDPSIISGTRIIDLSDLPKDPKISLDQTPIISPSATLTPSPTTKNKTK